MTNWYVLIGRAIILVALVMLFGNYVFYYIFPEWFALYDAIAIILFIIGLPIRLHGHQLEKRKGS